MIQEQTLVLFKPDVLQRQIVGELITRFERKGYKMVAMKIIQPTAEQVGEHYHADKEYLTSMGMKTINNAKEKGEDVSKMVPYEVGAQIRDWNVEYLTCGPVVAMVLQGPHIIEMVRKLVGITNPKQADIGTIRGDYSPDSYTLSDMQGRTTRTVIHASDSVESADREIPLWFEKDEIFEYEAAIEKILYDTGWTKGK